MGRGDDEDDEAPLAPGWYPDPWSATGEGERYYDGKKWGSAAKPLARHSKPSSAPLASVRSIKSKRRRKSDTPAPTGRYATPGTSGGFRNWWMGFRGKWGPLMLLVLAVAVVWAIPKFRGSHHNNEFAIDAGDDIEVITTPTTTPERPPASKEESPEPLGLPESVPAAAGAFDPLLHQPDDPTVPVAFDPCRPVHYVVNPTGGPRDGLELVQSAVARVQKATGLKFVYDGTTTEKPDKQRKAYQPDRYDAARWAPVLIAWSDETTFPPLAGYVAGTGQPDFEYTPDKHLAIVTGEIVLDRAQLSVAKVPDRHAVRAVMLHELGHLVGLDHTPDKRQIMYSEAEFNVRDYAAGDLTGLALLGTQPCHPDL